MATTEREVKTYYLDEDGVFHVKKVTVATLDDGTEIKGLPHSEVLSVDQGDYVSKVKELTGAVIDAKVVTQQREISALKAQLAELIK